MKRKASFWMAILLSLTYSQPANGFLEGWTSYIKDSFTEMRCTMFLCCDKSQISLDIDGLRSDLSQKLHGQHLVQKAVVGHILGHFQSQDPPKALALSFHGLTGVGKNFVSGIIAKNLYKEGLHSPFVHLIAATNEFNHEHKIHEYKDILKKWIEGNVTKCERSMFIFDEVDKLPSLLLDVIKPYLDHYAHLGGVSYRKAIFIFISNAGGSDIGQIVLKHWQSGRKRDDLKLSDIENDVMVSTLNADNENGLWHSRLISNYLITSFIPFLPLEKEHVRACIRDDIVKKYGMYRRTGDVPEEYVDEVMQELTFFPPSEQVFSITGCKRVSQKVDFVMMDKSPKSPYKIKIRHSEL